MNLREAISKLQPGDHVFVMRESTNGYPCAVNRGKDFTLYIGIQPESQGRGPSECISLDDFVKDSIDEMIDTLKTYVKRADELKCTLKIVQDMSWATEDQPKISDYEVQLNLLCREYKVMCICCYNSTLPSDILLDAFRTHPLVIAETGLCRNFYFIPPELFSERDSSTVTAYMENVAALHQLEKTLKEEAEEKTKQFAASEKKYRTLVEHVPDVIYSLDSKGHFIEVNPALTHLLGYSRDELMGESFRKVVHPDDLEKASHSFEELVKGERDRTLGLQLRLVTKEGDIKIGELNARALYDRKGSLLRTEGIVRDITRRKQQEENLELLAGVVENVMEAVIITDSRGIITYVNPTACTMFGYAREELEGQLASVLSSGNSQAVYQGILKNIYKRDWEGEILAIRKDGWKFPVWMRMSALRNDKGDVTAIMSVSRDVTEQKEAEEKLQRYALLLEMKVREKTKGTETLLKTSYALRSTSNWKKGTEIITKGIVEGLGFDRAAVFFVNEPEDMLECRGQLNISERLSKTKIPLTDDRYAVVKCVKERRPILVKDRATDVRVEASLEGEADEFVWVPILFQSEVLGALGADRKKSEKPIETEDVDMLELYANQITEFIERTRLVVEPEVEKQVSTPLKYNLELQDVYLVEEEKPEKAYDMFTDLVRHGFKGFGICRTHPQKIREKYALEKTPVMWLSEIERKQVEQVGPQDIPKLIYLVSEFIKRAQPAVVIVEGLEYLVVQNDFKSVLKLIHTLSDYVATSQSILLLPVNPHALPQHQYVMLKRSFRVIS